MVNYQNGKIYAIRSHNTDRVYIGSACTELYKRFYDHKAGFKRWKNGSPSYTSSYEIFNYGDCYIELLEKYPCKDREELKKREGHYIRTLDCVNINIAGRSQKEYQEERKEYIKEYHKNHYKKKTPSPKTKKKGYTINDIFYEYPNILAPPTPNANPHFIRIKCECGHIVRTCMMPRHKKSGNHIYLMNEKENNQEVS